MLVRTEEAGLHEGESAAVGALSLLFLALSVAALETCRRVECVHVFLSMMQSSRANSLFDNNLQAEVNDSTSSGSGSVAVYFTFFNTMRYDRFGMLTVSRRDD